MEKNTEETASHSQSKHIKIPIIPYNKIYSSG